MSISALLAKSKELREKEGVATYSAAFEGGQFIAHACNTSATKDEIISVLLEALSEILKEVGTSTKTNKICVGAISKANELADRALK